MSQQKSRKKLMVVFGALSGWITSMLVMRIGKGLAFVVGAVIICMEFMNEHEFIRLDWNKINDRFVGTPDNFRELNIWNNATESYTFEDAEDKRETRFSTFLSSFIGGVLVAIASH